MPLTLGVSREYKYFDEAEKKEKTFAALKGVPLEPAAVVREEGKSPGGVLPGETRLDDQFTYDAMLDELDKGFPVVHIASHFHYEPANPDKSFLLIGRGAHLELSAFDSAKRIFNRTALVTLSACDTALGGGPKADGREVEGLGFVAQKLGAQSDIASLWPVSDLGARILMPAFYRLRQADPGLPKAEAPRRVQLALLRGKLRGGAASDGRRDPTAEDTPAAGRAGKPFRAAPDRPFEHPYYRAPFILIGNWK